MAPQCWISIASYPLLYAIMKITNSPRPEGIRGFRANTRWSLDSWKVCLDLCAGKSRPVYFLSEWFTTSNLFYSKHEDSEGKPSCPLDNAKSIQNHFSASTRLAEHVLSFNSFHVCISFNSFNVCISFNSLRSFLSVQHLYEPQLNPSYCWILSSQTFRVKTSSPL